MIYCNLLEHSRLAFVAALAAVLVVSNAPQSLAQQQPSPAEVRQPNKALPDSPLPQPEVASGPAGTSVQSRDTNEKQSKRILWIFPNYRR